MRVPTIAVLIFFAACAAHAQQNVASLISKADEAYRGGMETLEADYRKAFAEAIGSATKIEVYLLDFEMTDAEDAQRDSVWAIRLAEDQFPIVPYGNQSKILKRKMLSADEIKLLMPSLQKTIAVEKNSGGAMCHFPIHGIRVWDAEDIVFQTSICHHCMNFYMTYPFGGAGWTSLSDPTLRTVLEQFIPIPQKEIDRFEQQWGGKKKDAKK